MFPRVISTFSIVNNLMDAHVEDLSRLDPAIIHDDSDDEWDYGSEWLPVSTVPFSLDSEVPSAVNTPVHNSAEGSDAESSDAEGSQSSIARPGKRKNGPSQRRRKLKAAKILGVKSNG